MIHFVTLNNKRDTILRALCAPRPLLSIDEKSQGSDIFNYNRFSWPDRGFGYTQSESHLKTVLFSRKS